MLRPASSLLGSSRAARRAHVRAERGRALASGARGIVGMVQELIGFAWDAALLLGLPVLYLAASYLVLDLPSRWLSGREPATLLGAGELALGVVISLLALVRVLQQAPPIPPVSPQFARRALLVGWLAAVLLTVADVAG